MGPARAAHPLAQVLLGHQPCQRVRRRLDVDWKQIIPQYQDLWEELAARREKDAEIGPGTDVPHGLDPHELFRAYPSGTMAPEDAFEWRSWPNMPADLMTFPRALGLPDAPSQINRSTTLAGVMGQLPQDGRQWQHAARIARWAARRLGGK